MVIKKRWIVLLMIFLVTPLLMLGSTNTVRADDTATGAQFYLAPVYPANQTDKTLGYFVLKVTPGQKGSVSVQVQNTSKTNTRKIQLTPTAATTSDAGQINYSPSPKKADPTLAHPLNRLFSKPVTIIIPPDESKVATFEYIIPEAGFKGQILGSIHALDVTEEKSTTGQFGLHNKFAMAVGIILSQNPTQTLAPDLKLQQVRPGVSNKHPAILARIRNRAPQLFRGMTINAKITKQGETKTIYQYKLKDGSMAPNSNFDAPILGDEKGIPAGDYTLTMTVQAEGKTWRFKRNFTVTDKEAAKLAGANNAGNRQPPWQKWLIWAAIALAVLIAGYGLYLLGVRRGHKNDTADAHHS